MSGRLRLALLAALLAGGAPTPRAASAGDPPAKAPAAPAAPTEADRAFFAWWDAKGFPDVRTLPFVTLSEPERGGIRGHGSEEKALPAGAFLVRDEGRTFTIFRTDLRVETVPLRAPDAKEGDRGLTYRTADLAAWVRQGLDLLAKDGPDVAWFDKADPFGAHRWSIPNQAFRLAVLGRALAARGEDALARTMCDRALHEATRPRVTEQYGDDDPRPRSTYDAIEEEIRSESSVALEEKFGDGRLSWADLLEGHEAWARAFAPEDLGREDGAIATLRHMVEEARERAKSPSKPLEGRSPAERIEALVHDLQDVGGSFYDAWGYGSERDPKDERPPPANEQLERLGLEAVPALIEALDDERFTRTLELYFNGHGQFRPSFKVLRVGEMAWMILDQIARGALASENAGGPPTSGRPTRRRAAQAWFASVTARGEKAVLAERVALGTWASRAAADRLVELDPIAAVGPLETGILAADEYSGRRELVGVLASLHGDAAIAAMLRLLEPLKGSEPGIRVAAALWAGGRREGLDALIAWWKASAKDDDKDLGQSFVLGHSGGGLIAALAATGDVEGVRALSDGIDARSARDRVEIVTAFEPRGGSDRDGSTARAASPEAEAAIEALLAERLLDGEHADGMHLGSEPFGDEPIVGEMAAWTLARRYPQRFAFDERASGAERKAARLAMANRWRAQRGQPALPAGPTVRIEPLAPERAKPLIDAWLSAGDDEAARGRAEAAIFSAGLAALPALEAAREALAAADPRRGPLDTAVQRLAAIVRDVQWSERGPRPNASLVAYAEGVRGQPLTGAWVTGLWRQVAIDLPEGSTGIDLLFARPDDGTGGVLRLELTTGTVPWGGGDGGWILGGDGLELVDGPEVRNARSWWHKARAPQVDGRILAPETRAYRMRWSFKRARG